MQRSLSRAQILLSYAFLTVVVPFASAQAQSLVPNPDSETAAECSALYSVMTALGFDNEQAGEYFGDLLNMTNMFMEYYLSETNNALTNGEISAYRRYIHKTIENMPERREIYIFELENCSGWLTAASLHLQNNNQLSLKDALDTAPRPSLVYEYPFSDFNGYVDMFDEAYSKWSASGKLTLLSPTELLERSSK